MKKINNRNVADNHEKLLGNKIFIDGWEAEISDSTQGENGEIYIAVKVKALTAIYLEQTWHKLI